MAITLEEYNKVENALNEAEKSDNPFLVVNDDELSIIGDANKTEKKSNTYSIVCRFPLFMKDKLGDIEYKESGNFIFAEYKFENVYLSPRQDLKLVKAITEMLPFFKALREDGNVEDLTEQQKLEIIVNMPDKVLSAMYDVVKAFLQVEDDFLDFALTSSIMETLVKLITDFPEAINEADIFFG